MPRDRSVRIAPTMQYATFSIADGAHIDGKELKDRCKTYIVHSKR